MIEKYLAYGITCRASQHYFNLSTMHFYTNHALIHKPPTNKGKNPAKLQFKQGLTCTETMRKTQNSTERNEKNTKHKSSLGGNTSPTSHQPKPLDFPSTFPAFSVCKFNISHTLQDPGSAEPLSWNLTVTGL